MSIQWHMLEVSLGNSPHVQHLENNGYLLGTHLQFTLQNLGATYGRDHATLI